MQNETCAKGTVLRKTKKKHVCNLWFQDLEQKIIPLDSPEKDLHTDIKICSKLFTDENII